MSAMDAVREQALAVLVATCAELLGALRSAMAQEEAAVLAVLALAEESRHCKSTEQAATLAELALAEKTRHATVAHAEVSTGRSLANERCCQESAEHTTTLAATASADDKEAAGCAWNSLAATVFVVDTRRPEMAGATPHRAVAKRSTALVLPPLDD
jgi:hypothetical protein